MKAIIVTKTEIRIVEKVSGFSWDDDQKLRVWADTIGPVFKCDIKDVVSFQVIAP